MNTEDQVRLRHIIDALETTIRFTEGHCQDDLERDEMLTFALLHAIQIVGEAATKISPETREALSQVPWGGIIGMRHRLVHAYFDVDFDILWTTATEAAPELLAQIKPLLMMGD